MGTLSVTGRSGLGLIELMIALGISGMVLLGSIEVMLNAQRAEQKTNEGYWLDARRTEFASIIRSQVGWADILARNPNMACFSQNTGCAGRENFQPLILNVGVNTPNPQIVDGNNAGTGMNAAGDFCNTFDAVNGNDACSIGIRLFWQAVCDSAACFHPQPKLTIQFQRRKQNGPLESLDGRHLVVYKDPKLDSLNEVCQSMGGAMVGTSCTLPQLATSCDVANGQYVLGFSDTGSVICGRPNIPSCGAGKILSGFDAAGGPICSNSCADNTTTINAVCGSAHGVGVATAPNSNLCLVGSASSVNGSGPWTWSCNGLNGGSNTNCSAPLTAAPVAGVCGAANGTPATVAPASGLCAVGTASSVIGAGPWTWTCSGLNGAAAANCSAPLSALRWVFESAAGSGQTGCGALQFCPADQGPCSSAGVSKVFGKCGCDGVEWLTGYYKCQ